MVLIRRSPVLRASIALAVLALILGGGASQAASKAKVTIKRAGSGKVYVPASIISGSLVTKGRAFYRPGVPESSLAGIRLGRPANEILLRWGNPTRITLGTVQGEAPAPQQPAPGIPYIPSGRLMEPLDFESRMGGLPGLPGLPAPGAAPTPTPGASSTGGESPSLRQEEVTWTYDLANGITLEFIITEGIITQITVGGIGPWGLSKTRTGLQLGDSYKLVLWVCGYPDSQKFVGRFLRLSYVEKSRLLFTLADKRVVGITIALVPQEISQK